MVCFTRFNGSGKSAMRLYYFTRAEFGKKALEQRRHKISQVVDLSADGRYWEWLCENAQARSAGGASVRHARMAAASGPAPMIAIIRFRL